MTCVSRPPSDKVNVCMQSVNTCKRSYYPSHISAVVSEYAHVHIVMIVKIQFISHDYIETCFPPTTSDALMTLWVS